jgi:hypothetical protein
MGHRSRGVVVVLCGLVATLTACGSSGPDCSAFTACGGAVVGVWTFEGGCGEEALTDPSCPAATISDNIEASGTLTFGADMKASEHRVVTGTATIVYPASCVAAFQVTACSELQGQSTTTTCTGDVTKSCTCKTTVNSTDDGSGDYSTAGGVLTVTPTGGNPTTSDYCVSGSTLRLRPSGSTAFSVFSK